MAYMPHRGRLAAAYTDHVGGSGGNQISDGGELTGLYQVKIRNLIIEEKCHDKKYLQISCERAASIGYYTNASLGLIMRVGYFKVPFWSSLFSQGEAIDQTSDQENITVNSNQVVATSSNKFCTFLRNQVEFSV